MTQVAGPGGPAGGPQNGAADSDEDVVEGEYRQV